MELKLSCVLMVGLFFQLGSSATLSDVNHKVNLILLDILSNNQVKFLQTFTIFSGFFNGNQLSYVSTYVLVQKRTR
jgi:hypothetical protein